MIMIFGKKINGKKFQPLNLQVKKLVANMKDGTVYSKSEFGQVIKLVHELNEKNKNMVFGYQVIK